MRRESRELAMQVLFQKEFAPEISMQTFLSVFENSFSNEVLQYANFLLNGVEQFRLEIDRLISTTSKNWKIDRMSSIDRNVLRISIYEMHFASEPMKPQIVINEAIEIAKKYGTTDSYSFVNGILNQITQQQLGSKE
ncbi:MAG TPA: transcription antitermination factor NusB [Pseudobdellovibrionaceae bacterium]|nr:transcription antitermination factor NusB [Pseudobdellovibrionaceae bacterium]